MTIGQFKAAPALRMSEVEAGYSRYDQVLDRVSLTALPGRVTAVLGPNGSGKSTTLRVLSGFLAARSGQVMLDDEEISGLPPARRLDLGIALLPQGRSVFPNLTVNENLRLGAWRLRRDRKRFTDALSAALERYPALVPLLNRPAGRLSGGQARLLEFARVMIGDPSVLLIDEPSVGLAPAVVDEVYDEIARLGREGRTILLVDQNVQAAVELADYVYTLAYGRNHLEGTRDNFVGQLDSLIKQWLNL